MAAPKNQDVAKKIKPNIKKLSKALLVVISLLIVATIYALVFIIVFSTNFYWMHTRNSKIEAVLSSPLTTKAFIAKINNHRHSNHATFIFTANGRTYTGETFQNYDGYVGDSICITYNTLQPDKNIYCADAATETFKKDVLQKSAVDSLLFMALLVFLLPLTVLRQKIWANKKTNMLP